MALVKCNHCRKETKNDTGKCRWCNKELEKNLDTIDNTLIGIKNTEIQDLKREIEELKEQKFVEDNFWICEQCQEENELNIEVCWKCQNVDKHNNTRKIKKGNSNQLKDDEIKFLSMKIIDELRSTVKIKSFIYTIGFLTVLIIFSAILSIPLKLAELSEAISIPIAAGIIFSPYNNLYKRFINIPLSKNYRRKAIHKFGLDNHKYINEINDIVKYSSVGTHSLNE